MTEPNTQPKGHTADGAAFAISAELIGGVAELGLEKMAADDAADAVAEAASEAATDVVAEGVEAAGEAAGGVLETIGSFIGGLFDS